MGIHIGHLLKLIILVLSGHNDLVSNGKACYVSSSHVYWCWVILCFRMSRRVSAKVKRKTTILQGSEQQPASRHRRVEENEEQADQLPGPASPPYAGVDDLIERVTNEVLGKLQNTQFNDNAGTGNVSLPGTASAVQGSVVAEPVINELSGSQVNTSEMLNSSDPASTAAAYRGRLWLCWIACPEAPV